MAESKTALVGMDFDIHVKDGKVVIVLNHVGADGSAKLEVAVDASKFYGMAIDKIEEVVPGDQKGIAKALKLLLDGLEF